MICSSVNLDRFIVRPPSGGRTLSKSGRVSGAQVIGEAVNLPIRTLIDRPGVRRRPDSTDPRVVVPGTEEEGYESPGGWNQKRDPSDYAEAVELWRRQNSRSNRAHSDVEAGAASPGTEGGEA